MGVNAPTRGRKLRFWLALVVMITAAVVIPAAVMASDRFMDVSDANIFHDDIAAIADAGVTLGCNPPANDNYCPDNFVTRGQMAAFMNRLGALGPGKTPVVNADRLDGNDVSFFAAAADSRFISLSPFEAFLDGGTVSDGTAGSTGVRLADSGSPGAGWAFTIPPDYTTGDELTVRLLWHTPSTSCGIALFENYLSVGRAGRVHITGGNAASGLVIIGGNTLTAPATSNQSSAVEASITTPDGVTDLEPGDAVAFGVFRESGDGADTCTGDLVIQGIQVSY